jgi:hypothetical protein
MFQKSTILDTGVARVAMNIVSRYMGLTAWRSREDRGTASSKSVLKEES